MPRTLGLWLGVPGILLYEKDFMSGVEISVHTSQHAQDSWPLAGNPWDFAI